MIDPFVALAPILVLPIVGLLRYIGCVLQTGGIPSDVTVTVSPPSITMNANQTQQFTATVTGTLPGVTWSLTVGDSDSSAGGGTVNPQTGLYQSPLNLSVPQLQVTIIATTTSHLLQTQATGSAIVTLVDNG
jgi:hypothetical protein